VKFKIQDTEAGGTWRWATVHPGFPTAHLLTVWSGLEVDVLAPYYDLELMNKTIQKGQRLKYSHNAWT